MQKAWNLRRRINKKGLLNQDLNLSLKNIDNLIQQRRFDEAQKILLPILKKHKNMFEAWVFEGVICANLMHLNQAKKAFQKALSLAPNVTDNHINLGNVFYQLGQFKESEICFNNAISLNPTPRAYLGIGLVLVQVQRLEEAAQKLYQAANLFPNDVQIIVALANLYQSSQKSDKAAELFEAAIEKQPDNVALLLELARLRQNIGQLNAAKSAYEQALKVDPNHIDLLNNYGMFLSSTRDYERSQSISQRVLKIDPNNVAAFFNIGNIHLNKREFNEARRVFQKLIKFDSENTLAIINNALIDQKLGNYEEAEKGYIKALRIDPDNIPANFNIATVYQLSGKIIEAIKFYGKALSHQPYNTSIESSILHLKSQLCDWEDFFDNQNRSQELIFQDLPPQPFDLISIYDDADIQKKRAENWINRYGAPTRSKPKFKTSREKNKIRIAYISSDFREHPVMYLLVGVLKSHDRSDFEIYGYSLVKPKKTEEWPHIDDLFDSFTIIENMTDDEVVEEIRSSNIDIAVDLTGHTQNGRPSIFNRRVAPVQINFLGYPGTFGNDAMDFIIADEFVIPESLECYYSENVIRIPGTYMPTDDKRKVSDTVMTRKDHNLPDKGFVFCCFNNAYKLTPCEFDIWMQILHEVKDSVLWLRIDNAQARKNLREEAKVRNVDPKRLIFADRISIEDHLARYKFADLVLDTFAFNGHTTTCEALWSGAPVLTKVGESFAARVAGSLLNVMGLTELITFSNEEYKSMALEIARNESTAKTIRKKLNNKATRKKLFDTNEYTRKLEKVFFEVVKDKAS